MRSKPLFSLFSFIAIFLLVAASSFAQTRTKASCQAATFPALTFSESNVFPSDRSLHHPEDGVGLADGSVIVGDEVSGLKIIDKTGKSRPYGKFKDLGWIHNPPKFVAGPNGMFMEAGGRHLLLADVYSGKIYRVDVNTEETRMIYDHQFGINSLVRDSKGNIWFTQSAKNTGPDEMWNAVNRPVDSGAVFYLQASEGDVPNPAIQAAANIYFANGIALDSSEEYLYVAETMMDRVLRYNVDTKTGTLTNRKVYQNVTSPDNLKFDQDGNLWIASPISNTVYADDKRCGSLHTAFSAPSAANARIGSNQCSRTHRSKR